ncbi:MAG: helix-turn-helix domain-containing protein [Methylocystis sp.]
MTTTQLDNIDPLLNIDQTSAILGINRNTLATMIKNDVAPPFVLIGRRRYILASKLRAWVESKHRRAKSAQNKQRREVRQYYAA